MSDLYGPITRVTLAFGLWLVPLAPLLAAAYALYAPLARAMAPRQKRTLAVEAYVANVAVAGAAIAFASSAWWALRLAHLDADERYFLEHVFRLARFGQLDVTMDLALDPLSAVLIVVVSGVGLLLLVLAARAHSSSSSSSSAPGRAPFFGWSSLLIGATLVALLADGLVVTLMGWQIAALATWGLTRDARALVMGRAADAALLVGIALVFWGYGGVWADGDYTPDLSPRFAAVRISDAPDPADAKEYAPPQLTVDEKTGKPVRVDDPEEKRRERALAGGKGELTITSYPDALVFMDDSRTPILSGDAPARAPLRKFAVDGGLHSFRIHPGNGLDDYLVSHVPMGHGRDVALEVFGPSVTYRQLQDQLDVKSSKDGGAAHRGAWSAPEETSPRGLLAAKKAGAGVGLVTLASVLLLIGAAGRSGLVPLHRGACALGEASAAAGGLAATTAALLGAYLLVRMSFFVSLSGAACALVACVGALTALVGAWTAARAVDLRRVVACLGVSELGHAVLGVGVGAPAAAATELGVFALAGAALWACAASLEATCGTDLRALGGLSKRTPVLARAWLLAIVVLWAAPLPVLGGFWSKYAILSSAAFASQLPAYAPGWLFFAFGAAATGLGAFGAWRAYLLAFEGRPRDEQKVKLANERSTAPGVIAGLLAGVAALGGAVFALDGRLFGRGGSLASEWLEPLTRANAAVFSPTTSGIRWGLAIVLAVAGIVGWSAARARFGDGRKRGGALFPAASDEGRPAEPHATPFFAQVADGVERWVLDGLYGAVAAVTRGAAQGASVLDEKVFGYGGEVFAERFSRLGARSRATLAAGFVAAMAVLLYLALHRS